MTCDNINIINNDLLLFKVCHNNWQWQRHGESSADSSEGSNKLAQARDWEDVSISHSCHGDDDPVECSGDVSEAGVILHLNVVGETGEDETRYDEDHDEETKFWNALTQGEHNGLETLGVSGKLQNPTIYVAF